MAEGEFMQTSDFDNLLHTTIEFQQKLIEDLRAENSALLEVIFHQANLLAEDDIEHKIEIPSKMKGLGKIPWYQLKAKLELIHRKPKLSEIAGIPEKEDTNELTNLQTEDIKDAS